MFMLIIDLVVVMSLLCSLRMCVPVKELGVASMRVHVVNMLRSDLLSWNFWFLFFYNKVMLTYLFKLVQSSEDTVMRTVYHNCCCPPQWERFKGRMYRGQRASPAEVADEDTNGFCDVKVDGAKLSERESQPSPASRSILTVMFISLLLDLLAFTVILPLLPSLLEYYGRQADEVTTCLLSTCPVAECCSVILTVLF